MKIIFESEIAFEFYLSYILLFLFYFYVIIFFLHTNYQKIVEKDFIYYFIIAILSGANRLTFRVETTQLGLYPMPMAMARVNIHLQLHCHCRPIP
jgi:hypothetical protein